MAILVFTGLVLGLIIAGLPTHITLMVLAAASITYAAFSRPVFVMAALLCIVPFNILWMGVGITPLEAGYGLTYAALAAFWVLKRFLGAIARGRTEALSSPITLPLAAFLCFTALACVIGVLRGHTFSQWGSDVNAIVYYCLCFIMLDLIREKRVLYRILFMMLIATALGLIKSIYIITADFPPDANMLDVQHIRLSYASVLGLGAFLISAAAAAASNGRKRAMFTAASVFFMAMLAASFGRSLWIAAAFGLAFLFFASGPAQKSGLVKWASAIALLVSLYLALAMGFPPGNPLFNAAHNIEKRYESIFTAMDEPSLMTRGSEWREAGKKALEHPFFGNGLGTQITYFRYDRWFGAPVWQTTRYVHNVYLYIFLNMGLFGLALFLWFYASLIRYGLGLYRRLEDRMDRSLALGITCSFAALMVASLAGPLLASPMVTMWAGFFAGALIILDRSQGKKVTR